MARSRWMDASTNQTGRRPSLSRCFGRFIPPTWGPAGETSEYRFLCDDRYLYIGARAFLGDPSRLRMPFVRHDKVNATMDYVQVYLDPQNTHRASYVLRINARYSRADAYSNEATQTENNDPDYDWEVRTQLDRQGWTAEYRIPPSTLHVPRKGQQVWSFIADRPWIRASALPRLGSGVRFASPAPKLLIQSDTYDGLRKRPFVFGSYLTLVYHRNSVLRRPT